MTVNVNLKYKYNWEECKISFKIEIKNLKKSKNTDINGQMKIKEDWKYVKFIKPRKKVAL